jgi:preprotein translocase subunit SecY
LDNLVSRVTVIGVLYLIAVCVVPIVLNTHFGMPIVVGGTSVLIVAGVALDTMTQIQSHLIAKQYASVIKKANRKSRFRV